MKAIAIHLAALLALLSLFAPAAASVAESVAESAGDEGEQRAIFAGGCFWCVEEAFDAVDGVTETTSGYIGGDVRDPTYKQVTRGGTGHAEAVAVRYDPAEVSYPELLEVFWHNIDPTDAGGQFCDRGNSYRTEIFYTGAEQREAARASKEVLAADPAAPSPIVTEITEAGTFWPAEDYHQNYHRENPLRYAFYKRSCGRAARLEELWGPKAS